MCICNTHASDFRKMYEANKYQQNKTYISWCKKVEDKFQSFKYLYYYKQYKYKIYIKYIMSDYDNRLFENEDEEDVYSSDEDVPLVSE